MNQEWWGSIVQWGIWGILMTLIMGWVAKSRLKIRSPSDSRQLFHPSSTLVIGTVGFLLFASLAVISNVFPNETTTWWTTTIFIVFTAVSLTMVADYFLARHEVSEIGMNYGRLIGTRKNLKWSDIRRVNYAPSTKWFRIETQSGDVARISAMLIGLPEFATLLLAHTPHGVIDSKTLPILQETAAGNPPPVWG